MLGVVRAVVGLAVVAVVCNVIACTARIPRGSTKEPRDADVTAGGDDSLSVSGEDVLEGASTAENPTAVVRALEEIPLEARVTPQRSKDRGPSSRSTAQRRVSGEAVGIIGHRSELRVNVRTHGGLSSGLRTDGSGWVGFLRVGRHPERPGIIRSVQVGRLSVRMGQRLILGRRLGVYASSAVRPVRTGVAVVPSLSRWFGRTGVGVETRIGRWTCHSVFVGVSDTDKRWRARALWFAVVGTVRGMPMGVSVGEQVGSRAEQQCGITGKRPSVVSGHASVRWNGIDGSGEMAWFARGGIHFALRAARRGLRRHPEWSLLLFRAPYGSSSGDFLTDLCPGGRTFQGARLDVSGSAARVRATLACLAGQTWSVAGKSTYRRVVLSARGRRPSVARWEFSLVHSVRLYDRHPTSMLLRRSWLDEVGDLRFRMVWETPHENVVSARIRFDYMPRSAGRSDGTLLLVGMSVRTRRLDARLHIVSHALSQGSRGLIARAGVGSFERFFAVYGRGSDVSVRVQLHLTDRLMLLAYHGSSWSGPDRLYLGVRGRL